MTRMPIAEVKRVSIGQQIRELRRSRMLTRPELAKRSKISRSHLWNIEHGHMTPGLPLLEKLSGPLNVGLGRFFRQSETEMLLEDPYVRLVHPFLSRLTPQQREFLLRTIKAAPRRLL
jgi:transcriptional regulator with XRE-family HTH domain